MQLGMVCETLGCAPSEIYERGLSPMDMIFLANWYCKKTEIMSGGTWSQTKTPTAGKPVGRHVSTRRRR